MARYGLREWSAGYYTVADWAVGAIVDKFGLVVTLFKLRLYIWWR